MRLIDKLKGAIKRTAIAGAFALSSLLPITASAQTFFPSLDAKITPLRQPDQTKESVWDTLSTWDQTINFSDQQFAEDKTDTITYIPGKFESGNFATQAHINFYGTSGYQIIPEDTTFKYDITNIGKFNMPLYTASVSAPGFGHGVVWHFAGNHPTKGDTSVTSPLDFYDGVIREPQTDQIVEPGSQSIPLNCKIEVKQTYWFYQNGKNNFSRLPFLTFNIVNGVATLASYDTTRLMLERNFAPRAFNVVSPENNASISSCNDPINFAWRKSVDRDAADTVKYKLKIKDKSPGGLETIFSDITDTTHVLNSRVLKRGFYDWSLEANDGKEITYSDTSNFSIMNTPPTTPVVTSPAAGETVEFDKGILKVKYASEDADKDNLSYTTTITGPHPTVLGKDTTYAFTTPADSVDVDSRIFKPSSNYSLEVKVTDGIDTSFTNPLAFSTPTITGVERINGEIIPNEYSLSQNYPNPFNPQTKIRYSVPKSGNVSLKVYDVLGREVETIIDKEMQTGTYEADFSSKGLSSGVYIYRLQAGDFVETKKMVVNK